MLFLWLLAFVGMIVAYGAVGVFMAAFMYHKITEFDKAIIPVWQAAAYSLPVAVRATAGNDTQYFDGRL